MRKEPINSPNAVLNNLDNKIPKQERSYSQEEVIDFIKFTIDNFFNGKLAGLNLNEIFEQFKNK